MRFKALTYDLSTQRLDVKLGWLPLGGKDVVSLSSWCRSRAWRGGWAELSSSRWAGLGETDGQGLPAAPVPWAMQPRAVEQGWEVSGTL